jgi:hypothetical protein
MKLTPADPEMATPPFDEEVEVPSESVSPAILPVNDPFFFA